MDLRENTFRESSKTDYSTPPEVTKSNVQPLAKGIAFSDCIYTFFNWVGFYSLDKLSFKVIVVIKLKCMVN